MNSISWFLYLIEVTSNVREMATAVLVGGAIAGAALAIFFPMILMMLDGAEEPTLSHLKTVAKTAAIGWCVAIPIFLVTPSKNTMYAMAASEVGETMLKTEIASDATKALHQWIKKQIEPASADKN
jgi:hypothetical protein